MKDHNGVLMMQRVLLAGTLGLAMARKAAAILEGEPSYAAPARAPAGAGYPSPPGGHARALEDRPAETEATLAGVSGQNERLAGTLR